ncbi:hypothetical protein [Pseudoalteromonas rubra]|uniref:6-bladed beta-propeller n=1 Tax=Pseudoalteromonas rubra TaxID=43658 RepID=A0A0F4QGV5_9GAMM|nr:hypothetical protein [Pseudoalteromonas rubra]KJZ06505.1 hypothetical protein TW77_18525 [Pseudoalteromonas rubra]
MERRTFLKSGSLLCASGVLPASAFAANTSTFTFSEQDTQRVDAGTLDKLGLTAPKMSVQAPSGEQVTLTLKPSVSRRYGELLYVYFEMSKEIAVFDAYGNQQGAIALPEGVDIVSDFAIEPSQQLVYLIVHGNHHITVTSFYGEKLGQIGEFGIDMVEQLNGPKSITLDAHGHLHILEMGTHSIKVFNNNGAFLYTYGQARLAKQPFYRSLDGTQNVVVSGGQLGDRKWIFNKEIRKLMALN